MNAPSGGDGASSVETENSRPKLNTIALAKPQALRPYQVEVINQINRTIAGGHSRVLLVAPTGSGKTVMAASRVGAWRDSGKRVLFLAHRRELISQASVKLHGLGLDHGVILAGYPPRPSAPIQVGSVQSFHARAIRSNAIEVPPADLIVIDEAHHARSRTYEGIIRAYPDAIILGLTATPCRSDGRGLGNILVPWSSVRQCAS